MNFIKCPNCQAEIFEWAQFCAECGIKLEAARKTGVSRPFPLKTPREALVVGSIFSERFTILEELGQGRLGKVYKAFDKSLNREVVLKLIKPEIAEDKKMLENLGHELQFARKIVHKNVGRTLDLNEEKGTHFITMEYVPGQDLKGLLRQTGRLKIEKATKIALQVCEGLAQAHLLGIAHLDLSPGNIMVDKEGQAKILDFGIARSLCTKGISDTKIMIPTSEYMSPEQAEGKDVDQRSDIYSLGIILYEMMAGRVPSEGEIPKIPEELAALVPEGLARLILRCLEKDKEKRYQTAEGLRSDLEKIVFLPVKKPICPKEIKERLPQKRGRRYDLKKLLIPGLASLGVIVLGTILWRFVLQPSKGKIPAPAASKQQSLAILPFEDITPGKGHEYLGEGIAESLIDALASIDGLRVPARTSSFSFKGKTQDWSKMGLKLGVDYFLGASVQVIQDKLLISAKLIQVKDGLPVWSKQYDRRRNEIFALQDEMAREIVDTLGINLPGERQAPLVKNYTGNLDAYNLYLQARFLLNKKGKENLEKAVEYFQKAVEKDPAFAPAHAGLAETYSVLGNDSVWPPNKAFPKAKAAVLNALQAAPNLAEAHALLAMVKGNYEWDLASAESEYKVALRIKPGLAAAHQGYAVLLSSLGRHDEAIAEINTARTLDPLSPKINADVGALLYFARLYDLALEELKKASSADPSYYANPSFLGLVYIQTGQYEEALRAFRQAALSGAEPREMSLRTAYVYALLGQRNEVGKILTEALKASNQTYVSPVTIGTVYAALGEKDQVFACLQQAIAERDTWLVYLKVYPMFDLVRRDQHFISILRKIGLQE